MPEPTVELKNLRLSRFSFVDEGDNPGARITMSKDKKPFGQRFIAWFTRKDAPMTTAQRFKLEKFYQEFSHLRWAFRDSVEEIMKMEPTEEMSALIAKTTVEFVQEAKKLSEQVTKGDDSARSELLDILTTLEESTSAKNKGTFASAVDRLLDFELPEPRAQEPGEPEVSKTKKNLAELVGDLDEGQKAELAGLLGGDESMKSQMAAMKSALDSVQKKLDDAEAEAKKLRDEQLAAKRADVAKSFNLNGVDSKDVIAVIAACEGDADTMKSLETVLKALSAQKAVGEEITEQISESTEGGEQSLSAKEEISKRAQTMTQANPDMSFADAYMAVIQADPDLYAESQDEV